MTQHRDAPEFGAYQGRAKEDYSQSAQNIRSCVQLVVAANGGVALAMLSCLTALATAEKTNSAISIQKLLLFFSISAGLFLLGAFCALISLFCFSKSRENWGHFWEDNAETMRPDYAQPFAVCGTRYGQLGFASLLASVLLFVPGACSAISGFLF